MRKINAAIVVGLLVIGAMSYWVWKTQYDEDRPMDFSRLTKHMENFTPKYRSGDCLVRVDMTHSGEWTEAMRSIIFRNLMRFVSEEAPQMGVAQWKINPKDDNIFIQFSDNCPDRYNVMREWVRSYTRRYDSPRLSVSNDIIRPGPETLDTTEFHWLD